MPRDEDGNLAPELVEEEEDGQEADEEDDEEEEVDPNNLVRKGRWLQLTACSGTTSSAPSPNGAARFWRIPKRNGRNAPPAIQYWQRLF